jgi:general secretion pathway protein G
MNLLRRLNAIIDGLKRRSRFNDPILRRTQAGMTLIEIMVVVAIIGLLMGTVGVVAYNRFKRAKLTNAKQVIANVQQALGHYRLETNKSCPADLDELFKEKYITKKPRDPWGEKLIFKCPGEHNTEGADVSSKGPDKQEGTDDDITSWDGEESEEE